MPQKTYRVIQWMTGDVGRVGVRHFAQNPIYDLVGVLVHNPDLGLIRPRGLVRP